MFFQFSGGISNFQTNPDITLYHTLFFHPLFYVDLYQDLYVHRRTFWTKNHIHGGLGCQAGLAEGMNGGCWFLTKVTMVDDGGSQVMDDLLLRLHTLDIQCQLRHYFFANGWSLSLNHRYCRFPLDHLDCWSSVHGSCVFPQTLCPHWGILTVRVKAGAWSGCSLWAAAFFL